ncbi:MAG: hypothetical protein HYX60_02940, partial [Legionella longbeachae]|nr:hypothetical protein [Legionella longbeachae]
MRKKNERNHERDNIKEFTFHSIDLEGNKKLKKIPGGLKHVLVFGAARQGKSSIIQQLLGKDA